MVSDRGCGPNAIALCPPGLFGDAEQFAIKRIAPQVKYAELGEADLLRGGGRGLGTRRSPLERLPSRTAANLRTRTSIQVIQLTQWPADLLRWPLGVVWPTRESAPAKMMLMRPPLYTGHSVAVLHRPPSLYSSPTPCAAPPGRSPRRERQMRVEAFTATKIESGGLALI